MISLTEAEYYLFVKDGSITVDIHPARRCAGFNPRQPIDVLVDGSELKSRAMVVKIETTNGLEFKWTLEALR